MIQVLRSYYLLASFFLSLFALSSCKSSCRPQPEISQAKNAILPNISGLNLEGLSPEKAQSFIKLLNDEISPCGCPSTFAQCLAKKECPPAQFLAEWALTHLKAQSPERALYQALSEEINKGFMSEPLEINTHNAQHKGNKNAPIVVVEFADFECPACKLASRSLAKVYENNREDIQVYFMHYPLNTHPHAEAAAVAAEAAAKQGKFWHMHDALFAYEGPLSESAIQAAAASIFTPRELAQYEKDKKDPSLLARVRAQKEYALNELNLNKTPTFLFNGRPYNLSLAEDGFLVRIAMEKARASIKCTGEAQ